MLKTASETLMTASQPTTKTTTGTGGKTSRRP
jgi:hypothetical protein